MICFTQDVVDHLELFDMSIDYINQPVRIVLQSAINSRRSYFEALTNNISDQ